MHCQPQTHRDIKTAKLKPLQEYVAEIMWMRKQEQYTRNTRSKAFTAAQHRAYHPCCTSSKRSRCSRHCLCTNNQNGISLEDSCFMGRYTLSTGERLLRGNCGCIFRVTQSFECRQLFTSRNGSATQKTWIFSNKLVLTSSLSPINHSPSSADPELLSISSTVSHYEGSLTVKNRRLSWIPEWPVLCPKELTREHQEPAESNTVERHLFGVFGTASHPDMQKIRVTGFFFENRPHWQFEVRLLLFTVCTASKPFEYAWYGVLEDTALYCTWSDNR
jgi:hypothetical protein